MLRKRMVMLIIICTVLSSLFLPSESTPTPLSELFDMNAY